MGAAPAPDPLVGATVARRYKVEERLGADAVGRVYRAESVTTGAVVSLRLVHEHLTGNRAFASRLQEAAAAAAGVTGSGVIRLLEAGQVPLHGQPWWYVVNEAFDGRNLCSIVQVRGPLPVSQAVALCLRAVDALAQIHDAGVVHGDLKPENVIVGATSDGEVCARLSDCVIAALAARHSPRLGTGGTALGTPIYRAPELRSGGQPTVASDLYSMGVILYEQLTGLRPFDTPSCLAYERWQQREEPQPPRRKAPSRGIGAAVEAVVMKALARDPQARHESAVKLAKALREAVAEDAPGAATMSRPGLDTGRSGAFGIAQRRTLVGRADVVDEVMASATWPAMSSSGDPKGARGAAVMLLGGAGMGKSAIVHEVTERLTGGPVCVLRVDGRCAVARPLEPFVELARDLLGIGRAADSDSVAAVSAMLHGTLGFDAEDVARLVDRVTARPSSLAVPPHVAEREEVASLRAFLGRVLAARPTLLVVEDVDALDAASLELVRDLMHAAAKLPICVLATSRSDPWPEWVAAHAVRVSLPSLDGETSKALLRSRLAGRGVPSDAVELALAWTKGSPLLIELCARAMVRRELLVGSDGRWVPPSGSQDLFGGMRELVAMAMRAARAPARRWISFAAMAGHRTPVSLLEAWEPVATGRDELLQSCLGTGIVRLMQQGLVFDNEGVRDTVQALVPEADRKQMRAFHARWLRATTPPRATLDVVAVQLEGAGEPGEAARLFEQEARDLVDRGEARAGCALLARAQRLFLEAGSADASMRVGLEHVEALLKAGDGRAASDMLGQLERLGPVSAEGLRARAAAAVATSQGDRELALRALRRASDLAVDSLDQLAWYDVESELAGLLHSLGRAEEALTHGALALELARSLVDGAGTAATAQDSGRVSQSAAFQSRLMLALGRYEDARAVLQTALEAAALSGDETSAARLLAHLAHAWASEGEVAKALEFGQRALDFARRSGDRMATARVALNVGAYLGRMGRTGEAARAFALAKSSARAVGWDKGVRLAREATASLTAKPAT